MTFPLFFFKLLEFYTVLYFNKLWVKCQIGTNGGIIGFLLIIPSHSSLLLIADMEHKRSGYVWGVLLVILFSLETGFINSASLNI